MAKTNEGNFLMKELLILSFRVINEESSNFMEMEDCHGTYRYGTSLAMTEGGIK